MKKLFCIYSLILHTITVYSQAPKGPGGSNLFKKGDCERAGVDFNVCVYCEDKELTKNCKKYWCTDNGTCTEAPLKQTNGLLEADRRELEKSSTQIKKDTLGVWGRFGPKDTTSKLPKGLSLKNGQVRLESGYTVKASKNGKVFIILKGGGLGAIQGGFTCACSKETAGGSCLLQNENETLKCLGTCSCKLSITISGYQDNLQMALEDEPDPKSGWKIFVFPGKTNQ